MVPCRDERQVWTGLHLVANLSGDTTGLTKMGSTGQRVKLYHSQQSRAYPATRSQTKWVQPDGCSLIASNQGSFEIYSGLPSSIDAFKLGRKPR